MSQEIINNPSLLYTRVDGMPEISSFIEEVLKTNENNFLNEFGVGFLSIQQTISKEFSDYPTLVEICLGYKDFQDGRYVSNTSLAFLSKDQGFRDIRFKDARLNGEKTDEIDNVVQILVNSINSQNIK
ncbi:TPA: hypothetical protein ACJEU7_002196 [Acinetobacter baumannii]|uniref:hypothetical protein n=1 Tax=Acinetobacter baumannii TaxID=470 RepID=UPI00224D0285|nr:hypothetical protein [Acinetobacter baumannii]MCX3035215.1 hypothetical protein [Acinetobacter baumannii]